MSKYDRIFLQREDGEHSDCDTYSGEGMTWCEDKINEDDVGFVNKEIVDGMIDELIDELKFLNDLLTYFEGIGVVGVQIHEKVLDRRHSIKKALKKAGVE